MKILVLVLQYPPDVNSTGQLMAQLADAWVSQGHEVSVITSFPHYEDFRIWPEFRGKLMERESVRREGVRREGVRREGLGAARDALPPNALRSHALLLPSVTRVWLHANGTKTMLHRLASYLSFNAMASTMDGEIPVICAACRYMNFSTPLSTLIANPFRSCPAWMGTSG